MGGPWGFRGGSGPPCRGRCCRWAGGGGWRGARASAGYQAGGTGPPGRPGAGAPRPPSPVLRPALPPRPLCPVLPANWGPCQPSPLCPWAPSLPRAPGSGALPPVCPLARVSCPILCHSHPCLLRWRPRPSRALARAPCRGLCPSVRCPCPCPPCMPVLTRCCLRGRPVCAPARSHRCVRCGPSLASVPWRCCSRLRPPLAPVLLLWLPPSLCRSPPLSPRSRGWHSIPPDRRLPPPGPRTGHLAAAVSR